MGSVKVDEIGVSVGQKERPNGLSVGSRSASDKKVVPPFIQDKIRIGSLISWPAISDIWLGVRTVPVLSVAKESRGASARIAH